MEYKKEYDMPDMGEGEKQLLQLRQMNSLLYYRPSQSSLYSTRQQKQTPFQTQNVVPGGTATTIVNLSDFCYGPTSYLQMNLVLQKGTPVATPGGDSAACTLADVWGQNGSCLNVLQSARLVHRSGQELSYVPFYLGQLLNIKRWYEYNESERLQLDALLNQNYVTITPGTTGPAIQTYNISAMIPLSLIFGEFAEHTQCIPTWLLSGARMDFILNPSVNAVALADCSYTSVSFNLLLDCVNVYDSVQRQLISEMSNGSSGIQFVYETNFQTSQNVQIPNRAPNAFSFDINQSNSIVKNVFCVFMLNNLSAAGSKNSFVNVLQTWQSRIGSHYMPSQPMALVAMTQATAALSNTIDPTLTFFGYPNSQQAYQNTIVAFDAQAKQFASYLNTNSVTIDHFISLAADPVHGASRSTRDVGNLSVYGFLLDKAPNGLAYSGQSTNNSRLLNLTGYTFGNASINDTQGIIIAWTTSLRCANIVGDSLILDR